MAWRLVISETANKQLSKLDRSIAKSVKTYLADVCQLKDPAVRGHALTGPWAGYHRYRVGQLRMIVFIDHNVITLTLLTVGRQDAQNRRKAPSIGAFWFLEVRSIR